jgi:hypothetical protein
MCVEARPRRDGTRETRTRLARGETRTRFDVRPTTLYQSQHAHSRRPRQAGMGRGVRCASKRAHAATARAWLLALRESQVGLSPERCAQGRSGPVRRKRDFGTTGRYQIEFARTAVKEFSSAMDLLAFDTASFDTGNCDDDKPRTRATRSCQEQATRSARCRFGRLVSRDRSSVTASTTQPRYAQLRRRQAANSRNEVMPGASDAICALSVRAAGERDRSSVTACSTQLRHGQLPTRAVATTTSRELARCDQGADGLAPAPFRSSIWAKTLFLHRGIQARL